MTSPVIANHRARLEAFYTYYKPEKLSEVDELLEKYADREASLFEALEQKYSVGNPDAASELAACKADLEQLEAAFAATTIKMGQQSAYVAGMEQQAEAAAELTATLATRDATITTLERDLAARGERAAAASAATAAESALATLQAQHQLVLTEVSALKAARDAA